MHDRVFIMLCLLHNVIARERVYFSQYQMPRQQGHGL